MSKLIISMSIILSYLPATTLLSSQISPAPKVLSKQEQNHRITESTCKLQMNNQQPTNLGSLNSVSPALFFSPDGKNLAATNRSGGSGLVLFDISTGNRENFMPRGWMGEVSFSQNGKYMAFGANGPSAFVMNLQDKSIIRLEGHERRMGGIQFSPDSRLIATTSLDNKARVFDLRGNLQTTILGIPRMEWGSALDRDPQITSLSWSASGQLLVLASGKKFTIWDSQTRKQNSFEKNDLVNIESINRSPLSEFIPTQNNIIHFSGGVFRFFNSEGVVLKEWSIQDKEIRNLSFSRDGRILSTVASYGEGEKLVKLWNLDGKLLTTLKGHREEVTNVLFSQNNACIITSSFDHIIRLWDISGKELAKIKGSFPIVLSSDDRYLATVDINNDILVWKLK